MNAEDVRLLATPETIDRIVATPAGVRTAGQTAKLRAYFLAKQAPDNVRAARTNVAELTVRRAEMIAGFPTSMVMQELPQPRDAFVLVRGQYDKPGEPVAPGVPATLNPLPPADRADRLALARWLVDPANPLTARVAANRAWQSYFGTGLVKTVDDFGAAGRSAHPSRAFGLVGQ